MPPGLRTTDAIASLEAAGEPVAVTLEGSVPLVLQVPIGQAGREAVRHLLQLEAGSDDARALQVLLQELSH